MAEEIKDNGSNDGGTGSRESILAIQTHIRESAFDRAVTKLAEQTTKYKWDEIAKRLKDAFAEAGASASSAAESLSTFTNIVEAIGGSDQFDLIIEEAKSEAEEEYKEKLKLIAKPNSRRIKLRRNNAMVEPAAYRLGKDDGISEGMSIGKRHGYDKGYKEGLTQGRKLQHAEAQRRREVTPRLANADQFTSTNKWSIAEFSFSFSVDRDLTSRMLISRVLILRKNEQTKHTVEVFSRVSDNMPTRLDQARVMEELLTGIVVQAQPYCDSILFIEAIMNNFLPDVAHVCRVSSVNYSNIRAALYRAARINTEIL